MSKKERNKRLVFELNSGAKRFFKTADFQKRRDGKYKFCFIELQYLNWMAEKLERG